MFSNRLAIALVGIGCVAAAGAGSYVATRQNWGAAAAPTVTAAPMPAKAPDVPALDPHASPTEPPQPEKPETAISLAVPSQRPSSVATEALRSFPRATTPEPPAPRSKDENAVSERTSQPSIPSAAAPSVETPAAASVQVEEPRSVETVATQETPIPSLEELVVQADSVIGLETETALSSERARVEDRIDAHVARDVRANGAIAIPAGTRALGTVVSVERGGKLRERARLGIRFQTLILADGTRLPISTETIYRYGEPPGDRGAAKITGGAVAGAILGAIINGGKGAAIGAAAGAGAGTAATVSADRSAATFPAGVEVTARILSPITVTVEK